MSRHLLALCLALLASTYAAQAQDVRADCAAPASLDDGWTMATPKEAGFDPDKLCPLDKFIGQWTGAEIHGVVIVRHGKLVMERYYKGTYAPGGGHAAVEFGPTVKHGLFSISKSVVSLLIGIARGEGKFPSLDAPAIDHLPAKYTELRTPDNAHITLRDLLTMTSGLDWNESRPPYSDPKNIVMQMMRAPDPYRFVLQQPLTSKPGETYNYNSGDTELLGPLGITDFDWWKMPNGQPFAAAGLRLRPRDTAKLGQLLLTDGQWNGKQVVPKGWVAESTKPRIMSYGLYYGYQWWLGRSRDVNWTAGFGYGGQRLFVQPDFDLVVAITAGDYASPPLVQGIIPLDIFAQHVLPAIVSRR
jgi:CubicO group peptidase (beta-lactamase class C family)